MAEPRIKLTTVHPDPAPDQDDDAPEVTWTQVTVTLDSAEWRQLYKSKAELHAFLAGLEVHRRLCKQLGIEMPDITPSEPPEAGPDEPPGGDDHE